MTRKLLYTGSLVFSLWAAGMLFQASPRPEATVAAQPAPPAPKPKPARFTPTDVQGKTCSVIEISADSATGDVAWMYDATKFDAEHSRQYGKTLILVTDSPGVYSVNCVIWDSRKIEMVRVIVSGPQPPPGPGPGPTPSPAPIPVDGFRVLIVYESSELSKMPAAQQSILYSKPVRDYLNAKCVMGPDGKTKEWRIYDKDVATDAESKTWQDAMKRPRQSIPWLIVSDGKTGYEGPLPGSVDEAMAILKKWGG